MPATETADRVAQAKRLVARQAVDGRERRRVPVDRIEIRESSKGDGFTFEGYAAVFDEFSEDLGGGFGGSFREVIKRGAFKDVLKDDVRLLFNHDPNMVLARTTSGTLELSEDPRGLKSVADVAPTSYARDLRILLDRGDVSQMSFAFRMGDTGKDEWAEDEDGNVTRTIHRFGEMFDVSAVTYPAYPQTDAAARGIQKLERGDVVTFEERSAIEALLAANSTEQPIAEREGRADGQEPPLEAAVGDGRADVEETPPQGWRSPAAARGRVYALLERAL